MRLLVFSPYFYPHKGGHEKYVEELCTRLLKYKYRWEIDIVTAQLKGTKECEIYKGLDIIRLPSWDILGGRYPIPKISALKELKKLKKYDAVMTHTRFFPLTFLGTRFANKRKTPQLHVEHGTCHPPMGLLAPIVWLYDHTFGRFIIKNSTIVAGVSEAAEKFAQHLYKRETLKLPNSINTKFFVPKQAQKKKTIVFVGRLIEAKGVQDLFEAGKELNEEIWVIGKGAYEDNLRKIAPKNIRFLGEKNAEEICGILSKSTLFVNPSYNEGLPTSVLEAGAMGLPVIATDVGGTKEIINNGVNGLLVKPKDVEGLRKAMKILLSNPVKARKMGELLRKKIEKEFDWDQTAEKADSLLRKMVNS